MEEKKSQHLKLGSRRKNFFLMGMACALSLTLIAFEWKTDYKIDDISCRLPVDVWDDPSPIPTRRKKAIAQPEPRIKQTNMSLDQGMKILDKFLEDPIKSGLSKNTDPSLLGDIDVFDGLDNGDDEEEEGFLSVDPGVLDVPVDAKVAMPTFCDCEGIENAVARQKCNDDHMNDYLHSHLRYPSRELSMGQEGTAYVQYVVNRKGEVEQIKVGTRYKGFKAEAERVVSSLPCMKPASQNGHTVAVRYVLPIHFKIH